MPRSILPLAAIALALTSGACGGDGPTGNGSRFSGEYELRDINGQALPFLDAVAPFTGDKRYINSGEIIVRSQGRVSVVKDTQWVATAGGPQPEGSDTVTVPFEEAGDVILFRYPRFGATVAHTDTAMVVGSELLVTEELTGRVLGYARR